MQQALGGEAQILQAQHRLEKQQQFFAEMYDYSNVSALQDTFDVRAPFYDPCTEYYTERKY